MDATAVISYRVLLQGGGEGMEQSIAASTVTRFGRCRNQSKYQRLSLMTAGVKAPGPVNTDMVRNLGDGAACRCWGTLAGCRRCGWCGVVVG